MKKNNAVVFWLVAIVGIGLLTWGMIKLASLPENTNPVSADISPLTEQDNIKGNPSANVTLIEYSDFQCPACGQYYGLLKQLETEMGDQIKFVYRHYPLKSLHPNAEPAARAAEAAKLQGKFWEMHDTLFINQSAWSVGNNAEAKFSTYAETLGLNVEQFKTDLDSDAVKARVNDDLNDALAAGLTGTPTFFINGQLINNPRNYDDFVNEINRYLNQ